MGELLGIFGRIFAAPEAPPPPPPPLPDLNDKALEQGRAEARALARRRRGRAATILTSGLGVETPASTAKKTLLGE